MGTTITLTASDGHELGAYRADPKSTHRAGLVIIQEIFGVNAHIRDVCDRFAAQGYAAVAPAIFDRLERRVELDYDPDGQAKGRGMRTECDWDKALLDIEAAVALLRPEGKVGVVGFCWGGSFAWNVACRFDVDCVVGYYGGQIVDHLDEKPKVPLMLHFGEADAAIPIDDVARIKTANPNVPVYVYEGAGHGFNCDRRGSFHPEASKKAMNRTLTFLKEHL